MNMLNVKAFEKAASGPEPAATFHVLALMRRARDIAIHTHWPRRSRVKSADILEAMHAVCPEVWQAWRAWAGPGSERIDFESFKPCHHAVLEGFITLMVRNHAECFSVETLVQHVKTEYAHYPAWCAEDADCIARALRRYADADVLTFDGFNVGLGNEAQTDHWMRAYSEAYRDEGTRLKAEADALFNHMEA